MVLKKSSVNLINYSIKVKTRPILDCGTFVTLCWNLEEKNRLNSRMCLRKCLLLGYIFVQLKDILEICVKLGIYYVV